MQYYMPKLYVAIVLLKCNIGITSLEIFAKLPVRVKWLSSIFSYFFAFTAHRSRLRSFNIKGYNFHASVISSFKNFHTQYSRHTRDFGHDKTYDHNFLKEKDTINLLAGLGGRKKIADLNKQ